MKDSPERKYVCIWEMMLKSERKVCKQSAAACSVLPLHPAPGSPFSLLLSPPAGHKDTCHLQSLDWLQGCLSLRTPPFCCGIPRNTENISPPPHTPYIILLGALQSRVLTLGFRLSSRIWSCWPCDHLCLCGCVWEFDQLAPFNSVPPPPQ